MCFPPLKKLTKKSFVKKKIYIYIYIYIIKKLKKNGNVTPCSYTACKWNKIRHFVIFLWNYICAKMYFPQDPLKAYIFYPSSFLYVWPKKPRNKYLLVTIYYYFMFKTFFSQVNKRRFFLVIHPLDWLYIFFPQHPSCFEILVYY